LSIDVALNYRVLLFTIGVALLTGLLSGLAPAWQATRLDPAPALKENASANTRRRSRFGNLLVVTQVALSLPLLVGAGLFLQTMRNLKNLDAGFRRDGVVTMRVNPSAALYRDERLANLWKDILARVARLPGVRAASLSTITPLGGVDAVKPVEVAGFTPTTPQDQEVRINQISEGFFQTFDVSLLQGRTFNEGDNETAPQVALLNETAARFYFSDRNPIGARLGFERGAKAALAVYQVIGVVRDSRYNSLREPDSRTVYLPMRQALDQLGRLTLAVRGEGPAIDLTTAVRNELRAAGNDILLTHLATLREQVDQSLLQERLLSTLALFFGLLALALACLGLYGVMSYDIARRTNELGIRMALGARKVDILKLVLRQGMGLVGIGAGSGLIAALSLTSFVSSQLYGVPANDPLTLCGVALLLVGVALLACWLPARRATQVEPLIALRCE
jgi:predicted permease